MRSEHYYHFIASPLLEKLVAFYGLVSKFNDLLPKVTQELRQLILEQASKFYGFTIVYLVYNVKDDLGSMIGGTLLETPTLFGVHPREVLKWNYADRPALNFYITYTGKRGLGSPTYSNDLVKPDELDRFDEFFKLLLEEFGKLEVVKEFSKTLVAIRGSSPSVRNSVLGMIKEPWLGLS